SAESPATIQDNRNSGSSYGWAIAFPHRPEGFEDCDPYHRSTSTVFHTLADEPVPPSCRRGQKSKFIRHTFSHQHQQHYRLLATLIASAMLRLALLVAFLSILLPEPLSALQVSLPFLGGILGLNGPIVLVTFLKIKPFKCAPLFEGASLIAIGHNIGEGVNGGKAAVSGGSAFRDAGSLAKSVANPSVKGAHTADLFGAGNQGHELGKLGLGKSGSQHENSLLAGKPQGKEEPNPLKPTPETESLKPQKVPNPNETPHTPASGEGAAVFGETLFFLIQPTVKPLRDYPFYTRVKEWYRQATTNKMLIHLSKYGDEEVKAWAKDNPFVQQASKLANEETVVGHYLSKVVVPNWRQTWPKLPDGQLSRMEKVSKGWRNMFGNQQGLRRGIERVISLPFWPLAYVSQQVSKLREAYNLKFIKWLRVNAPKNIAATIPHFAIEDQAKLAATAKVHPINTHP
ncbi:hypothetical protein VP01_455g2, partial [Puccinia sorghi]